MKRFLLTLGIVAKFALSPLWAGDSPVVVELFTSQGCSSCPPADKIFRKLAAREDVISIALHVDYWDYIGWKDTFGHPAHAARQRAYAVSGHRRTIYTPQMIVNGLTDIVGATDAARHLDETIAKHAKTVSPVTMDVARDGDRLTIAARSTKQQPMTVHMLRLIPRAQIQIERGENRGKTIGSTNVAKDWMVLGQWDGKTPLSLSADVDGDAPVVVLIQKAKAGAMLAAARLD